METLNLGITIDQGDDFNLIILIQNFTTSPPTPINITGYAFKGQMRVSTDPLGEVVAEFVFTIQDQTSKTGQVNWNLPKSVTTNIDTSTANALSNLRLTTPYVFDVKMQDTLGNVTRIIQGIIEVSPQVTLEGV